MSASKKTLVPILVAFLGVAMIALGTLKSIIKGEPVNSALLIIGISLMCMAAVSFAAARKAGGGSVPPPE
jgi:hypothetical protein